VNSTERDVQTAPLSRDCRDLVERAAGLPHGFAFLEYAPIESVASALGVTAAQVEHLRACLADPAGRAALHREFERATAERRTAPAADQTPMTAAAAGDATAGAPARRGPEEIIDEATRHPLGLGFLVGAPLETVAVTFSIHPFVVLAARELLARRGITPAEDPEDDAQG
jgi:hypothetical protein